jgi:surface antigen
VRRLVTGLALCQALVACSIATPLGAGVDSEPTGSISAVALKTTTPPILPASLDEEDRRRALGALAIALDPQGNGTAVRWDNPVSKAHGSVTPSGFAYPANNLICRAFSAQFDTTAGSETARGAACRDKDAQWTLSELRPTK